MDGRVLTDLFDEPFLASRPVVCRPPDEDAEAAASLPREDEEEDVIRRLKDLGYLL